MARGLSQPLIEMGTRKIQGCKADNIIAIREEVVQKMREPRSFLQSCGSPWPVTGINLQVRVYAHIHYVVSVVYSKFQYP
jgi:hypothetical protein